MSVFIQPLGCSPMPYSKSFFCISGTVLVVCGGNIGAHHLRDKFLFGFAVCCVHKENTVATVAKAVMLSKHLPFYATWVFVSVYQSKIKFCLLILLLLLILSP